MTVAAPGFAQESSDYPAPCDASKVTKADVDRAHTVFLSGKQYLEESNYDKAISYFKDAYSIDCSRHGMLPVIATAYERKGDKAEAIRALDEYLKRAGSEPDHEIIERRIRNLKDQLAREQPAPAPPAPAPAATATPPAPSAAPAPTTVEAPTPAPASTGGEQPDKAAPGGGHSALPWVITGVGGAAAVAGIALFAIGSGDLSTAEGACPDHMHCASQDTTNTGNRGLQLQHIGGGLIAGGLVVAAAGLVWHFIERPESGQGNARTTHPQLGAVAAPGYAGVSLQSWF